MKVLLVEDEDKIARVVARGLQAAGIEVKVCVDGERGFEEALSGCFDTIVLDIMLPGRSGLEILAELRKRQRTTPVILLTARAELDDRVRGLEMGADDYLTKPFFIEELLARIQALHRRTSERQVDALVHGPIEIDLVTRDVRFEGRSVELTGREFELLRYLMRSPGRVVTRAQILEHVWEYHFDPETNIVDVYIRRLRKKLEDPGDFIATVRGVGYRIAEASA